LDVKKECQNVSIYGLKQVIPKEKTRQQIRLVFQPSHFQGEQRLMKDLLPYKEHKNGLPYFSFSLGYQRQMERKVVSFC